MNNSLIATAMLCAACMHAAQPIKTSLATNVPGCQSPKEVTVAFKIEKREDFTQAVQSRLVSVWKWFDAVSQVDPAPLVSFSVQPVDEDRRIIAVARVEVMGGGPVDWTPDPRHPDAPFTPPRELRVCLDVRRSLPAGSLDARLDFASPAGADGPVLPADLNDAVTNASLAGPKIPSPPGPSTAAAKGFARELDLSGVVLSSVQDTTTKGVAARSRTTKATGDLFFAPVLSVRSMSYHNTGSSFVTFFTPMAIEAHASNQLITKDTLSQNRIVAGPEYELRWYARNKLEGISSNLIRLIVSGKSASDRDFKLIEPKFAAELRPIWGKANQPVVDPKFLKGTGHRRTTNEKIGRTLSPFVGFEEGRSYLLGLPATAETPLGRFTRGYMGGDLGVDLNTHLTLTTTQTMYVRGEARNDWVHYMKSSGQWTFVSAPKFASALFVTFEKGRLPPFRSSVNAITFGVRVQSSDWGLGGPR